MSAFLLGTDHIDFLLSAACRWQLTYWAGKGSKPNSVDWRPVHVDFTNADEIGRMLIEANDASVAYRYDEPKEGAAEDYRFRNVAIGVRGTGPIDVLKAVRCLEYQSCELPGWEQSDAWQFCQALTAHAISKLPGMDAAQWEWSRARWQADHKAMAEV